MLLTRLPEDSWTQTELRDADDDEVELRRPAAETFGPWGLVNYQLAALTDAVSILQYIVARSNGTDWPVPEPSPRPGAHARRRKRLTAAAADYLNSLRAGGGADK